ncbi:enoyl-CoA hydratase/isomerase family protein [Sphingomonas panacis]|uniref:enoyl-CoA hydratase/isomerase family protein n=1 Tax=Sphingomonas panacis TaxID=1560345 RepID=UPI0008411E2C|nr:enoyl-CoA hydratase/isomerase family protein [Sphingomonas panacis]
MITTELVDGIAVIRLARAASRNALGIEDWGALQTALETIASPSARVILLESAVPSAFCAGSDLKAMESLVGRPDRAAEFRLRMRSAIEALAAAPVPTIANIQGDCFGAGVALALACDFRVAGDGARFGVTPAKLGLSYPAEDVARLVSTVGAGQASRLLMSADTISASDAHCMGLVEVLGGADEAVRIATAVARNAPQSVVTAKHVIEAITRGEELAFDDVFDGFFASAAFAEGLKAFKEKRRPVYADEPRPDVARDAGRRCP